MPKFRKKPVVIEAITFSELVEYGKKNGANIVNDMPWSFSYKGHPITHENDECYLIPTLEGTMQMTPSDMLITGVNGEIYPCKIDIFEKTYDEEKAEDASSFVDFHWGSKLIGMNYKCPKYNALRTIANQMCGGMVYSRGLEDYMASIDEVYSNPNTGTLINWNHSKTK